MLAKNHMIRDLGIVIVDKYDQVDYTPGVSDPPCSIHFQLTFSNIQAQQLAMLELGFELGEREVEIR